MNIFILWFKNLYFKQINIQKELNKYIFVFFRLGQIQALSLSKIVAYTKDQRLADERQKDLRKKCLELWEVKDGVRRAPFRSDPIDTCNSLVAGTKSNFLIAFTYLFDILLPTFNTSFYLI